MSDKAKWGYLAGMLDGEGFISVAKGKKPAPNGNGYMSAAPRYNLIVSITGTNEKLMQWLVENFGGSWSRDKSTNPKWKPRCSWRCTGNKNKEIVLLAVLPYLVIKRDQAIIGLEMLRMNGEQNPQKREEFYLRCRELNKRGVPVTTNTPDCSPAPPKSSGCEWRWKPEVVHTALQPTHEQMIESGLIGNNESAPVVKQVKGMAYADFVSLSPA